MIEKTLLLVKPDGVERALIGRIISKLEECGLKVVAMKMLMASKALAGIHYIDDKDWVENLGNKAFTSYKEKGIPIKETATQMGMRVRGYLIDYISSGPIVAMVFEGNEAISITRKLVGSTAPSKADPSTIRGIYSSDSYDLADAKKRPIRNLVHASEDQKTAEREIKVWFKPGEILKYKRADETLMYG